MTGQGERGLLQVASPFKSTHSFWTLPAVQMTRNVCWGNWSLREAAGRSQSWEHWVKEMPSHTTFLTVQAQPCPSPHYAPPIWDTQTGLGRFLPSGVLHSTARGDSSTMSSKVSIPEST